MFSISPVFYHPYPYYYIPQNWGYVPFFADTYYSSPMAPIGDWISANKYYSSFYVPSFWGLYSRDISFASFDNALWYRSAGFTFFDSPWMTNWEAEPFVIGTNTAPSSQYIPPPPVTQDS